MTPFLTDAEAARVSPAVKTFLAAPKRNLIDGAWREPASGNTLQVFNPAHGRPIADVPASDVADVDLAVAAARQALGRQDWAGLSPAGRQQLLLRLADLLEAATDEFVELEILNNGMTDFMARHVVVGSSVQLLRYMAGWATKIEGHTFDLSLPHGPDQRYVAYTVREPIGVVAAIVPWNVPLLAAVQKIAPALACGCTVVLKPAEQTPLTALRLAELALEAGVPDGVLNVVTGDGPRAGAPLAAHPGVDKISFTGSTEVGRKIATAAAGNMTRVTLELGGKSPVIMLEDVDPKLAARGAADAIFINSGQVCVAGSRLYVHKSRFDAVVSELHDLADRVRLGSGFDPATQMGPLVSRKQQVRVSDYVASGVADGARIHRGGQDMAEGYFVRPTVLTNTDPAMRVVREEIFGPVVVAMPFDDLDAVARAANDTPFGLGASVWSNDLSAVHRLARTIKAGTVWVNTHNFTDPSMPFGGFKHSGIGREFGRASVDEYTEEKSICMLV